MADEIKSEAKQKMGKALDALAEEFEKVRTGRANPAVLNDLRIDYYGVPTPVNQIAAVKAADGHQLVITPWDRSSLQAIEKAIMSSDIGITPMNDGTHIKLPIPELSQDRRAALAKQAKGFVEEAKVALRNIRRDGNEAAKKAQKDGVFTEDELKKILDDIQKLTDRYIATLDKELAAKEKELMTV